MPGTGTFIFIYKYWLGLGLDGLIQVWGLTVNKSNWKKGEQINNPNGIHWQLSTCFFNVKNRLIIKLNLKTIQKNYFQTLYIMNSYLLNFDDS